MFLLCFLFFFAKSAEDNSTIDDGNVTDVITNSTQTPDAGDVNVTGAPEPDANVTAAPEPDVNVTDIPQPDANVTAAPEPDVNVTDVPEPDANVTAAPEPDVNVTDIPEPDANVTAAPEPDVNVTDIPEPDANVTITPDVNVTDAPEPDVNVTGTPEPDVNVTDIPEPDVNVTITPDVNVTDTPTAVPPTEVPTTVPPSYDFNAEKFCVCESEDCARYCEGYVVVKVAHLGNVLSKATKADLKIKIHTSSQAVYPVISYSSLAGKEVEFKSSDDVSKLLQVNIQQNDSANAPKELQLDNVFIIVNFVQPSSNKLLENSASNVLYADSLDLSKSYFYGNFSIATKEVQSDVSSLSYDGITAVSYSQSAEIKDEKARKLTLSANTATVETDTLSCTLTSAATAEKPAEPFEMQTYQNEVTVSLVNNTTTPLPIALKIKSTKTITVTFDETWKTAQKVAAKIDHGDSSLEIISSVPGIAADVNVEGNGDVFRNGVKDKTPGLSKGAIIAIAVVCSIAFVLLCVGIGFGIRACKRRGDRSGYMSNVILEPL